MLKKVSEYDQEIPQSQTADNPVGTVRKSRSTITRHQEDKQKQKGRQPKPPGGLNAFYWYQIFALDSAVVEVQEVLSSREGHLTNAMYHHGETL